MSLDKEPLRWSDPNGDVPDVLRDLMQAGASEVPSAAKMAALSAKVSATAASATTAAGASSMLGATKLWLAGIGLGAVVAGSSLLYTQSDESPEATPSVQAAPTAQVELPSPKATLRVEPLPGAGAEPENEVEPSMAAPTQPVEAPAPNALIGAPADPTPFVEATSSEEAQAQHEPAAPAAAEPSVDVVHGDRDKPSHAARIRSRRSSGSGARTGTTRGVAAAPSAAAPAAPPDTEPAVAQQHERSEAQGQPTEMSLLLEARRSLDSSPRRTLTLAAKHAELYPQSQFAQERDALEIEALTRSGELEQAREAARRFVRRFPNSAHAHRFRERLDL